ncbi:MAG: transcriptional repressor [Dehalococcoidia bacterium]|nr:MAG: transcriptional repressor [Dehalococcoidia bacterium]
MTKTVTLLNKLEQRRTAQRVLLLNVIRENKGHLDAVQLYEQARQQQSVLSLSTVYRNLKLFKELGLIKEHQFGNTHRCYESKGQSHHHLVCLGCGKILEFRCQSTEKLKSQISSNRGFKVIDAEVRLTGYCPECQNRLIHGQKNSEENKERG